MTCSTTLATVILTAPSKLNYLQNIVLCSMFLVMAVYIEKGNFTIFTSLLLVQISIRQGKIGCGINLDGNFAEFYKSALLYLARHQCNHQRNHLSWYATGCMNSATLRFGKLCNVSQHLRLVTYFLIFQIDRMDLRAPS